MLSLEEIKRMNAKAGRYAEAHKTKPFVLSTIEQLNDMPPFPFPNIGDASSDLSKDYEKVDSLFVDSSGFGQPGEPALTADQFKRRLEELYIKHGTLLIAIESVGEFQVHVGVWMEEDLDCGIARSILSRKE